MSLLFNRQKCRWTCSSLAWLFGMASIPKGRTYVMLRCMPGSTVQRRKVCSREGHIFIFPFTNIVWQQQECFFRFVCAKLDVIRLDTT